MKPHSIRHASFAVGAVVLALLVSAAFSEGLLRLIDFKYDYTLKIVSVGEEWRDVHMFEEEMFESDPVLLWKPKSSSTYFIPFNSYGYRGREVPVPKDERELRILAIGDSNTLGPAEYSWPQFLQDRFDTFCRDAHATVLNAGVYGYTSYQGIRRFEEGLRHAPDVVLIAFGWNDAVETLNAPDKSYGAKSLRFATIKRFMARNLRTYQLFRNFADRFLRNDAGKLNENALTPRVSTEDYRANLIELIGKAKRKGIMPVLLTRPNLVNKAINYSGAFAWRRKLSDYNAVVRDVADQLDVPIVDADEMFADAREYFSDDSHLARSGARRLADSVYSMLTLKPPTCPSELSEESYVVEYRNSDTTSLHAAPLDVTAGRDSYDLWIAGEGWTGSTVRIQYRLNGGELQQFQAVLDSDGKTTYFVSSATPKGIYRFIAFSPSGYDYYVRTNLTITVR